MCKWSMWARVNLGAASELQNGKLVTRSMGAVEVVCAVESDV